MQHRRATRKDGRRDIRIAVVGVTGAGKTQFIAKATGLEDLKIGHSLSSCTQEVYPVRFEFDGHPVTLIDTPGFDDTYLPDVDVLEKIAEYLLGTYGSGELLDGLILLQHISVNRLTNNEWMRTKLFQQILGDRAYSRVVIATTMWDTGATEAEKMYQRFLEERSNTIWREMCEQGARVERHDNTQESALRIVKSLTQFSDPITLQLQEELERNGGRVMETSAGQTMANNLEERREKLLAELSKLEEKYENLQGKVGTLQGQVEGLQEKKERLLKEVEDIDIRTRKLRRMVVTVLKRGVPVMVGTASIIVHVTGTGACIIL